MKIIYIDESGTIGLKKLESYFVISAVIFDDKKALKRAKNVIKRKKVKFQMLEELKASKLKIPQKQEVLQSLANKFDYRVAYIVVEKSKISSKLYKHKNITYNFLFGILIKNILKACNDEVRIISDNRTTKVTSADSLCDYIFARAYGDWNFRHHFSIEQADSHTHYGLQVADILANAIFANYNLRTHHLYNMLDRHFIIKIHFPFKDFELPDKE